jgi:pimeloyl-ACP methyl ester carboxylesterase
VSGAIDPILLLHGQPGGARDWDRVLVALDGRVSTIALDRPGWDGRSEPTGLEGNVRAAVAALNALGVGRATVVGHSLGAAVGALLAASHPARVGALVLVAPSANLASLSRLDRWLAAPVLGHLASAATLAGVAAAVSPSPLRRRIAAAFQLDERYLSGLRRPLLTPATWRAFVVEQRALVRELPALQARLGQISAPTTILAGAADRIIPTSSARRLAAQIRGARLLVLERTGHLIPLQRADAIAEVIAEAGRPRVPLG